MSNSKPQRAPHIPTWGIFLLFLGIVFLLHNFDILPWGVWGTLWRFWPVLIIIIGLGILLRHRNPWLVSLLVLAILLACLGIAIWQYQPFPPGQETTRSYSQALDGLVQAQIETDFSAVSLTMSSLPADSPNLVEANSQANNGGEGIIADFHRQNNEGQLRLSMKLDGGSWSEAGARLVVRFTRNIPLTIDVKSAASNLDVDLSELKVTELQMDVDVGNYTVKMPASAGTTHAHIKANVANMEITIPDGVAAKLKTDGSLSTIDVNESRFPRTGDYYLSRDFATAENRIELEIDCNVGRVQVK